jgi:hypothetical protein
VALNCACWALAGRKSGMMEKWKEIHINCSAIFQYSNDILSCIIKKDIRPSKKVVFYFKLNYTVND